MYVRKEWTNASKDLASRPAPPIVLDWRPVHTEVAASGEMGLSTGPWKLTSKTDPTKPPSYGQFVSIWKREPGGPWKVAADIGVSTPANSLWDAPLDVSPSGPAADPDPKGVETIEGLFQLTANFTGVVGAYRMNASPRFHLTARAPSPLVTRDGAFNSPAAAPRELLVWWVDYTEVAQVRRLRLFARPLRQVHRSVQDPGPLPARLAPRRGRLAHRDGRGDLGLGRGLGRALVESRDALHRFEDVVAGLGDELDRARLGLVLCEIAQPHRRGTASAPRRPRALRRSPACWKAIRAASRGSAAGSRWNREAPSGAARHACPSGAINGFSRRVARGPQRSPRAPPRRSRSRGHSPAPGARLWRPPRQASSVAVAKLARVVASGGLQAHARYSGQSSVSRL